MTSASEKCLESKDAVDLIQCNTRNNPQPKTQGTKRPWGRC